MLNTTKMPPRPYKYTLSYDWSGEDCLGLHIKGYRTNTEGVRENFPSGEVFDGKDPKAVIEIEQALYKILGKSVDKAVIVVEGDQSEESSETTPERVIKSRKSMAESMGMGTVDGKRSLDVLSGM